MVKSLLENQTLFLEKYLHELIPAVITCLVAKQLCTRPDVDNHWALRDFASRLMTNICKNFNTSTNNIQTRTTRMFADSIKSEKTPLVSCYGALAGLNELGHEVIKSVIVPQIKALSNRIEMAIGPNLALSTNPQLEKTAVQNIRSLLLKSCVPVLKATRQPPDVPDEYVQEFGSLGMALCEEVQKKRKVATQAPTVAAVSLGGQQSPSAAALLGVNTTAKSQVLNTPQGQRYVLVNQAGQQGQPVIVSTQNQQRVFLASNTSAPSQQPQQRYGLQYYQAPPQN